MSVAACAFSWLDILEKEFDKAFVTLDLLLGQIDEEQTEITDDGRAAMTTLSSCFAQLCHKLQTMAEANAKLEAQLINVKSELVEALADRQVLTQQVKETIAKLQTSQLECQILKNDGEIEGADRIRQRLTEQLERQHDELKQSVVPDIRAHELEKENEQLKRQIINLQSELFGSRLTAKYLDKELAGRIQQIQLLGRDLRGPNHENLWNQLEAEIHLHRHKTVIRTFRGHDKVQSTLPKPPGHDARSLRKRQGVGEVRKVEFHKGPNERLGISITGGKEHGLPILISDIDKDGLAWRLGQLYIGDSILTVNEYDLRDTKHTDAARILTSLQGPISMTVVFVAPDDSDDEADLATHERNNHLKYEFLANESESNQTNECADLLTRTRMSESKNGSTTLGQATNKSLDRSQNDVSSVIDRYYKYIRRESPGKNSIPKE